MEKYAVFGELLYIGFALEKGRCTSVRKWKWRYKKKLYKHISILNQIIICIARDDVIQDDNDMIVKFIEFLDNNKFRKYYPITTEIVELLKSNDYSIIAKINKSKGCYEINSVMFYMTNEILNLLKVKNKIDRKRIAMLIKSLHNLPRVYLDKNEKTLCNLNQSCIDSEDAMEYCFSYLDEAMTMNLKKLLNNK